jgi:chemotaxis protein MotB
MRRVRLVTVTVLLACLMITVGCTDELKNLRVQNENQRKHIADLESQIQSLRLENDMLKRQLDALHGKGGIAEDTLNQKIAALEEDIRNKEALIAQMQKQLMGGVALPAELNTMLEEFAKGSDLVTYDPNRGVVRFKSDLLFEKGSDVVASSAEASVKSLCSIMNSEQGRKFDIVIAGHTDDLRILKPETREKHPSNWHLSAHRAISVLNVMERDGITPERMSVRGFSEYRPVAPNESNKKGNAANRRVEIFIVAKNT